MTRGEFKANRGQRSKNRYRRASALPELAPDPAVVLGLSPRESRADISDQKEAAMQRPLGPDLTALQHHGEGAT